MTATLIRKRLELSPQRNLFGLQRPREPLLIRWKQCWSDNDLLNRVQAETPKELLSIRNDERTAHDHSACGWNAIELVRQLTVVPRLSIGPVLINRAVIITMAVAIRWQATIQIHLSTTRPTRVAASLFGQAQLESQWF
jgi:hypothetical protein